MDNPFGIPGVYSHGPAELDAGVPVNDARQIASLIFDRLQPHLESDLYFNYLLAEDGAALRLTSYAGIAADLAGSIENLDLGKAVCGTVALRRAPIVAERIQQSSDPMLELVRAVGARAYACYPLLAGERLLGTLSFGSRRHDGFSAPQLTLMSTAARQAAAALARTRSVRDLPQPIVSVESRADNLDESRERLQAIFRHAADAMLLADDTGRYVDVNPAATALTCYGREDLLQRHIWDVTPVPDDARGRQLWRDFIRSGQQAGEYRLQRPDGSVVEVEYKAVANIVPGIHLSILRDVSERKRLEDQLRRQTEELARANQAKDEFLAMAAHELRTPLNAILGWAAMLESGPIGEGQRRQAVHSIVRSAQVQARVIHDLLEWSRVSSGKMNMVIEPVDLLEVIRTAVQTIHPLAAARQLRLTLWAAEDRLEMAGDAARLQQILVNLLENAVKFTPPDGRIDVRLRQIEHTVEIEISDTGAGISPDLLPHVFDRFRQGEHENARTHGGLGLGLSIVRHLTELHGGTISAYSRGEDCGATFIVRLPLAGRSSPA